MLHVFGAAERREHRDGDQLRGKDAAAQGRAGRDLAPTPALENGPRPASAWDGASGGAPNTAPGSAAGMSPSRISANLPFSPMQHWGTLNTSTRKTRQRLGRFVGTGKQAATARGQLPGLCHLLEGGGYCHHLAAGGGALACAQVWGCRRGWPRDAAEAAFLCDLGSGRTVEASRQ